MDVRKGFWYVELEEDSSLLTTFNTPFGRYRWKRMPFGISSAPEVFQRRIHELVEGLRGVDDRVHAIKASSTIAVWPQL